MPRRQQLFNRARPTPEEIHILRGIAKAMTEAAQGRPGTPKTPSAVREDPAA